jgi:predicted DCC family thiol-disulfide oxidoreductase YuxK
VDEFIVPISPETMTHSPQPVLLYDGECGLCNAVMRFMLKHDRRGQLKFAPLQGALGQAFLSSRGMNTRDFDSIVFIDDAGRTDTSFSLRTGGVARALEEIGWRRVGGLIRIVPGFLRDGLYRVIARLRYRIFGRYRPTPLPNPKWVERILD